MPAADRKAQIIDVASALIAERGYWGVSIQDVALRCQITDTAVLHHFGSKEKLLLAVVQHRDEQDRCALAARLGVARADLYDVIRTLPLEKVCEAIVRRNAEQPEIVRLYALLSAEALQPTHPVHDYFFEREQLVIATFASARSTLDVAPAARARLVLAVMDGVQLRWLRNREQIDLVREWRSAARVLFGPQAKAGDGHRSGLRRAGRQ
ncbi:TetR/AcrR family transcriptional regulator [Bradyrhizobium sp. HKCCYLS2038]|uniref:TetR/AcrR family transcriptional regulator n=1 Tax=unclassified Bradyrhizobium TaxID=2631580 RepID=UPI003EBD0BCF